MLRCCWPDCLRRRGPILHCEQQGLTRSAAAGTGAAQQEGWQLVVQSEEVLQCYSSPWDARYHSGLLGAACKLWCMVGLLTTCRRNSSSQRIQVQPFVA